MIAVFFAICAAASNATGTVLQRRAASVAPADETMHLALMTDLLRRPIWLAGILGLIGGFLFQALALSHGELSLVQPIVVAELPLTLAVAALVFRSRLDRDALAGALAVSAGLALVMLAISPHGGHEANGWLAWFAACVVSVGVAVALVLAGLRLRGGRRGTLFGAAAGLGFGFTAALMKGALDRLTDGVGAVVSSWQLYAMVVTGIASVFLIQNALQAGSLVAVQPAITICDPLTSVGYGVFLFGEHLRGGIWLLPSLVGFIMIAVGSVVLSRSPLSAADGENLVTAGTVGSRLGTAGSG
jgi:drug/metabolite transporter (DMT)-like permease